MFFTFLQPQGFAGPRPSRTVSRRAAGLGAVLLCVFPSCLLGAQAKDRPAEESPLDQAVRELDAPAPKTVASPHAGHSDHPAESPLPSDNAPAGPIQSFVASWELFHNSYLVGWLVAVLLSLVGVIVVARDQVFIGAAVSQASTLGIALALCVSSVFPLHYEDSILPHMDSWLCCDSFQVVMAVAFSVLAALLTARADRAKRESHEAITGWVFLISAGLSVLVVAHSPHGLEEIRRIHSSSIIGATPADVEVFAALLAATIAVLLVFGRRLLLFVTDPAMAAAVGINVGRWALLESLWLGLIVGLSIRVSGMLFTFGGLVLPALAAKNVCREVRPMFFVAPLIAMATNTLGFVLANRYDFPPAQMNVAIAGALLPAAWVWRSFREGRRAARPGGPEVKGPSAGATARQS
jgi:ABC-type Mn2+/Zn2+ transport system permease subunit